MPPAETAGTIASRRLLKNRSCKGRRQQKRTKQLRASSDKVAPHDDAKEAIAQEVDGGKQPATTVSGDGVESDKPCAATET